MILFFVNALTYKITHAADDGKTLWCIGLGLRCVTLCQYYTFTARCTDVSRQLITMFSMRALVSVCIKLAYGIQINLVLVYSSLLYPC